MVWNTLLLHELPHTLVDLLDADRFHENPMAFEVGAIISVVVAWDARGDESQRNMLKFGMRLESTSRESPH